MYKFSTYFKKNVSLQRKKNEYRLLLCNPDSYKLGMLIVLRYKEKHLFILKNYYSYSLGTNVL